MSSLRSDQERLERPVSPSYGSYPAISPQSFPCRPGSSILIDGHFEGSLSENQAHHGTGNESTKGSRSRVTIDMIPDIALLEIFDSYVGEQQTEVWHRLVHVCRKWRNVVFGSPLRLGLRLLCTSSTPVRETLDVWPLLPIVIRVKGINIKVVDNILAALEHNDRIRELELFLVPNSQMEYVLAAMQQPFPTLTCLWLQPQLQGETAPVVHASFLGGSAPRLHALRLYNISFLGLPKLLLSATHLVDLDFGRIPHSGYISPEAIVTGLSMLTRLERLVIGFDSPRSCPDRKSRRSPPIRTLLPVLVKLQFKGVSEYLEDLVARINAPLLDNLVITFFHQLIFDTPQLAQFINRTPKFTAYDEARVFFSCWHVSVKLPQTFEGTLELTILCKQADWQLSSLAQVCSLSFLQALIPTLERLYIELEFSRLYWQDDIESSQWLELFHPFTAVKDLHLSQELVTRIAPVLQEFVGERVTDVLPALQALFLEEPIPSGPVREAIGQFVAARKLVSHSVQSVRGEFGY